MSKKVGYARVSSKTQNLGRQLEALRPYVAEDMIVMDKMSGKDLNRPGYQSLKIGIGKLVKGDTLYIEDLDRLGRNKEDIKNELEHYKKNGIYVKVLNIPTTMTDFPAGQEWVADMINNILIEVLASQAEHERHEIKRRQQEGIKAMDLINGKRVSTKTGNAVGRPAVEYPAAWEQLYSAWKEGKITATEAMGKMALKRNSFYRLVKKYEEASKAVGQ